MAVYYVGLGGNDLNAGTSWATRLLTLNAAEDAHGGGTPKVAIAAGDTVWVASGVYREMLTCDVSGAAGSPITYIADVSGENTDGVGGVVRITGSDNDQTATRVNCITQGAQRNYRTFRGFSFDTVTGNIVNCVAAGTDWIIEDCSFQGAANHQINCAGANQLRWTIRRCKFLTVPGTFANIIFLHSADVDNSAHVVENCDFFGSSGFTAYGIRYDNVGDITIRNCTLIGVYRGIWCNAAVNVGHPALVYDCIIMGAEVALRGTAVTDMTEDFNCLYQNSTPRTSVNVGANSNTYPPLFDLGILHAGASQASGFRFPPPLFGALSQWSQIRAIADTGAATEDILGLTRPVTAGKRSWGAVQYVDMARDTGTVHAGTASKKLADAGRDQIYVPTTNVSTVFSVYVYREANYAGVNPQMIIKQPGQADTVVTDGGAAGAWNLLTTTLTPAALPGYVVIELVSNNTAAAGNYATYFDDLTVT